MKVTSIQHTDYSSVDRQNVYWQRLLNCSCNHTLPAVCDSALQEEWCSVKSAGKRNAAWTEHCRIESQRNTYFPLSSIFVRFAAHPHSSRFDCVLSLTSNRCQRAIYCNRPALTGALEASEMCASKNQGSSNWNVLNFSFMCSLFFFDNFLYVISFVCVLTLIPKPRSKGCKYLKPR